MTPRHPLAVLAVAAALVLTACGGDGDTSDAGPTTTTTTSSSATDGTSAAGAPLVEIERSRYGPDDLTVAVGTEVRFVNLDRAVHTVTARPDSAVQFDSGDLGQDEAFTQTFSEPGTYDYFCEVHPTMRATVTVQ